MKKNLLKEKFFIGKKGYILNKSFFSEEELNKTKSELNVIPFTGGDYGGEPEKPIKVYRENSTHLYIPKFFGINKYGICEKNIPEGIDIDLKFNLELRKEQLIPVEKTMEAYKEKSGGILSLGCGAGKTILGLYFISKLSKKTLIIVHKEFLMNQWIERIQFALPSARIGIIQGSKCEIENKDIVIGMLQSLSLKDFSKDTFDDFGHVIIDECHRIPSKIFMRTLFKINCKYMLGLSATPNRKDGCTKILKWFIGDIVYNGVNDNKDDENRNIVKVLRYIINSEDENYNKELLNFRGQVQMATMVNQIVNYLRRTKIMVIKIKEELDANENRQILILSDRKQQLEDFDKLLKESGVESVGYYVGGMKKNDLKKSESCRVLLGTYPMANEGLDIPSLNGLVLATPKSDIIQTVGRICRMKHENIQPLIIDLVDNFSVFEKQGKKRLDLYRKNKYEVEDLKFDMDKNQIFERKKYHYHNINLNCDTMKNKSAMGDKDISNYLDCVGRGGNKKDDKKEDLFNMFDDVF
jgi:superfamily II DNA or RNA helicase